MRSTENGVDVHTERHLESKVARLSTSHRHPCDSTRIQVAPLHLALSLRKIYCFSDVDGLPRAQTG